jgi:beta-galactosidase
MDEAHCRIFSIGIFSWVALEPEEERFEFGWLDRVMDRFAETGKYACLATPSAAMPAWMAQKYPDILRVSQDGVRSRFGNRVNFCWSSPFYKEKCRAMAERLAERYESHPALALWHVSNEYGGECCCDRCRGEFQEWLRFKFDGDLDTLNHAYWTAFWSHTFTDWSQIPIPGGAHGDDSMVGLALDWRRFVTQQIVEFFKNESEPLRKTEFPITTNLMGTYEGMDYWRLAPYLDVISWDSYPGFTNKPMELRDWQYTAFRHDLARSYKRKPWLLIESTPGSSNWYPVMGWKKPGEHRMEAMQAIAHGSDAVMYFQWRQSRGSKEKFHGAVVQHDGTSNTRVFREVAELGKELEGLSDLVGAETIVEVAVIYDWENAWAIELAGGPRRGKMDYLGHCLDWYSTLWEQSIAVDVIESTCDFSLYKLVIAPMLYMVKPGVAESLEAFVSNGGTLVLTCYSGVVDENDLCFQGGFPGPLRKLTGIWVEEIEGLHEGIQIGFSNRDGAFSSVELRERIRTERAESVASFEDGSPAVTCNRWGEGECYYIGTRADQGFRARFVRKLAGGLGERHAYVPRGVFIRRRGERVFAINFNAHSVDFQWLGQKVALAGLEMKFIGQTEFTASEETAASLLPL